MGDRADATTELRGAAASALHGVGEAFTISCTIGEAELGTEARTAAVAIELAGRRARAPARLRNGSSSASTRSSASGCSP